MLQLNCVGGNAKGLFEIDVMRCKNQGSDYDEASVQWSCTASIPSEFKLGSTDVICEGYDSPDDPYILKGSCGVEYRLILTEQGEEKYGRRTEPLSKKPTLVADSVIPTLFFIIFFGVLIWIAYSFCAGLLTQRPTANSNRTQRPGGGYGGGGGNDDDNNDPPPPYTPRPPRTTPKKSSTTRTSNTRESPSWYDTASNMFGTGGQPQQQQGWRPGFWTGAASGAAAGYYAGNRNRTSNRGADHYARDSGFGFGNGGRSSWDNGEGSSRGGGGSGGGWGGGSSSPGPSSSRYESTGFGGTSRR